MCAAECPICLDSLTGGLRLGCCRYSFHASCLLASLQDEVLQNWRCPCCRTSIDPAAISAAADLPGRAARPSADPEAGGPEQQATPRLSLSAINFFAGVAQRALLQERTQLDKPLQNGQGAIAVSGSSKAALPEGERRSSGGWVLSRVEELLPESCNAAAAAALASLRLQALLHPHGRGIAAHCGRWLGGAALLVLGCGLIVLLLERFMTAGMAVLTRANVAASRAFHLHGALNPSAPPQPWSIVLLLCVATLSAALQLLLHRHASVAALLLRLDRHAPGLLLLLGGLSVALAASVLAVTWIFSLLVIAGTAMQHARERGGVQAALSVSP